MSDGTETAAEQKLARITRVLRMLEAMEPGREPATGIAAAWRGIADAWRGAAESLELAADHASFLADTIDVTRDRSAGRQAQEDS